MIIRVALASLIFLMATGCDGDAAEDAGVMDMAVAGDLSEAADLAVPPDLLCTLQVFAGFPGITATERRLDCTCGCVVDRFESTVVAGQWNQTVTAGAFLQPTTSGLKASAQPVDGGVSIAAVTSLNPTAIFFIDGDFDLLVDYSLEGALPATAHVILRLENAGPTIPGVYTLERTPQQHAAVLGGIGPTQLAASGPTGTLELRRTGTTVRALANGQQITQFISAMTSRLTLLLTLGVDGCPPADAGPCAATVVWRNLRLTSGALVDRR